MSYIKLGLSERYNIFLQDGWVRPPMCYYRRGLLLVPEFLSRSLYSSVIVWVWVYRGVTYVFLLGIKLFVCVSAGGFDVGV